MAEDKMRRINLGRSSALTGVVGLGAVLACVGCAGSTPVSSTGAGGDGGQYGNGGSASGSSGGTDPSSSGAGASSGSGGSGSSGAASGSSSGSGSGSSSGSSGSGDAGAALGSCQPGDTTPCSSYANPAEDGGFDTIQLGPYGAQADPNIGKGYENTIQSGDQAGNTLTCQLFAGTFNETASLTQELLQTTKNGITINFALYSAYRPATWPSTPVPVITWGDGTCAQPEGYGALLRYVASYGYFIIAANSRWVGGNNADGSQPMLKALDFAAHANMDPSSPYYQKLDMTKVGAMGHSQGGGATATASSDSRIKYVIDFNANDSNIPKPYLAVSGDMDITSFTASGMASAINSATVPAAYLYYHNPTGAPSDTLKGHLVLMLTPERVMAQTVAWWQMWFRGDAASKADFVGTSCGFCGQSSSPTNAYEYGANSMLH